MKTIGLIGGLSWESTIVYYRLINERVRDARGGGGLCSASIVLHSFDFDAIVQMQQQGRWDEAGGLLAGAARGLYASGARCLAICTNTMHKVADEVAAAVPADAPLLHIGDATGQALQAAGVRRVGLLGTCYTMEQPFLSEYLKRFYGVETITPEKSERDCVHQIIFDELCQGVICPRSRHKLETITARLHNEQGAEAVILGCTELMLLIGEQTGTFPLPRFDTTALHAAAIADYALCASP